MNIMARLVMLALPILVLTGCGADVNVYLGDGGHDPYYYYGNDYYDDYYYDDYYYDDYYYDDYYYDDYYYGGY